MQKDYVRIILDMSENRFKEMAKIFIEEVNVKEVTFMCGNESRRYHDPEDMYWKAKLKNDSNL